MLDGAVFSFYLDKEVKARYQFEIRSARNTNNIIHTTYNKNQYNNTDSHDHLKPGKSQTHQLLIYSRLNRLHHFSLFSI